MRDVDRLRRSTSDRYLAGVAGGLGRHFDVDPTVVRVLIAVLTLFGGAGILLYAAVWVFVPEDGRDRALIDVNADVRRVVLVAAAAVSLMIVFGSPFVDNSWGWVFPLPLLVIAVVVVAVVGNRQRRTRPTGPPPPWGSAVPPTPTAGAAMTSPTTGSVTDAGTRPTGDYPTAPSYGATPPGAGQAPPAWMPPPSPAYVPPPRPRRTGLVLFWPTLALVAIGLGTLGIFDVNDTVPVSAYAALALSVVALALLVGAFVGRPGGLIALGLVASVGLGITSAVDAATDGDVSAQGHHRGAAERGGREGRLLPAERLAGAGPQPGAGPAVARRQGRHRPPQRRRGPRGPASGHQRGGRRRDPLRRQHHRRRQHPGGPQPRPEPHRDAVRRSPARPPSRCSSTPAWATSASRPADPATPSQDRTPP